MSNQFVSILVLSIVLAVFPFPKLGYSKVKRTISVSQDISSEEELLVTEDHCYESYAVKKDRCEIAYPESHRGDWYVLKGYDYCIESIDAELDACLAELDEEAYVVKSWYCPSLG